MGCGMASSTVSIACQIVSGGKRELVIRAGKSHKFTIPEDEVPR